MKYKEIINILKDNNLLKDYTNIDLDIENVSYDSRDINENSLFVCKGFTFKEEYLNEAISNGIICYMSEVDYNKDIPKIIVNDVRKALAIVSLNFYKDNLFKIGITGTKGKTTTNYFIHNILGYHLGYKPGILATHYFYDGECEGENHNTTPESLELHKLLNTMSKNDLKYVTMEVSSQATKLNRVFGMHYDIGCFLNIGEDHISPLEHDSFEDYLNCKIEFLTMCDKVIIYKQTDYYNEIVDRIKDKEIITYGLTSDCDYCIKNIVSYNDRISFDVVYDNILESYYITMEGTFNVINATCAIIMAKLLGVSQDDIQKGLSETHVNGRMEKLEDQFGPIIIDYAHNKLSAEALYKSVKETYKGKKIISVFGCPGDKGINRRKDMGTCAGLYADYIYLTSEDPGSKDVIDICNDIIKYIKPFNKQYEVVEDRKVAILKALDERKKGDVIVILGKGDEDYQITKNGFEPYEMDINVVKGYLKRVKI
jgi:UDP-N-acetylmuramyl-tripeptide synthetase